MPAWPAQLCALGGQDRPRLVWEPPGHQGAPLWVTVGSGDNSTIRSLSPHRPGVSEVGRAGPRGGGRRGCQRPLREGSGGSGLLAGAPAPTTAASRPALLFPQVGGVTSPSTGSTPRSPKASQRRSIMPDVAYGTPAAVSRLRNESYFHVGKQRL